MVSPLWKACSDGDLQKVLEFLNEPSALDIELKDHTGVTPLIEAVRNGHIEIVKVLLEKGADPVNASSQGPPETYTSDPAMLELLQNAPRKEQPNGFAVQQPVFAGNGQEGGEKHFYPQPPQDGYTYYPTINPSLSTVNEPGVYYPPQPMQHADGVSGNGMGNLPPPDVARQIPCRYFPACRYGAQCMFAHPQANYYQGPLPPVQFPAFDPMAHQYGAPPYYASPPPFQQPHPMPPMSPPSGAPVMHARTPSEVVSPSLGHFSPNGPPPGAIPYGPMSPPVYPHPGQVPMGMSPMPPLPPQHPAHPPQVPHSHPNLYNAPPSSVPPFAIHQEGPGGPYPVAVPPPNPNYPDATMGVRSPDNVQAENYNSHLNHRDGGNSHRRGTGRRPSFNARKPPCLFYPAGRCKNGDDCRFPHVLPDSGASPHNAGFPPSRGGAPRPRPHMNGQNHQASLEAKFGNMNIRDETRQKGGVEAPKHLNNGNQNANSQNKKAPVPKHQQRVPNADEFPVLAGSTTP
ncbi:hypothetical protein CPC08DRAFT_682981, partial [Agrocybe pediades]